MRSFRPLRDGSSSAALPALLRATQLLGLALGSAFGRLRESGATAARLFERAEENALLLRMMREAAGILGARWDKVPERQRPHYPSEQRFRILRIRSFPLCPPPDQAVYRLLSRGAAAGARSHGLTSSFSSTTPSRPNSYLKLERFVTIPGPSSFGWL